MRIAFFTDVHADVHTLAAALGRIDTLGCDHVVCGGDIVDYGFFPQETISLLQERKVHCVRGNHDRWAQRNGELGAPERRWLLALPLSWTVNAGGVRVAVHHGSPRGDMDGIDPAETHWSVARLLLHDADADVLLVGHTHLRFRWSFPGARFIANPGALLADPGYQPNEGLGGAFGVLDVEERTFVVHRAADGLAVEVPEPPAP